VHHYKSAVAVEPLMLKQHGAINNLFLLKEKNGYIHV